MSDRPGIEILAEKREYYIRNAEAFERQAKDMLKSASDQSFLVQTMRDRIADIDNAIMVLRESE